MPGLLEGFHMAQDRSGEGPAVEGDFGQVQGVHRRPGRPDTGGWPCRP
jgi:hypothetical protein